MIDARTGLYGVIGNPVGHSLSPAMHNAVFKALGLNAVYMAFLVKDLPVAVGGIRALGIRGVNVTIPHKWAIQELLDQIDPIARSLGAVNTVLNRNGRLVGYNTDWIGALSALQEITEVSGKLSVLIGAGGAARAAAFGLIRAGAEVIVVNRTEAKARQVARQLGCQFAPLDSLSELQAQILVNATPIGMEPDTEACPVSPRWLRPGMVVMDAVYAPPRTRLLQEAKARGCRTVDGLRWLVRQGAESFNIWLGRQPPEDVMERACRESLLGEHRTTPANLPLER
ncbi:MAG: shikimate dehydrogenase [Deltaproteobacteria bacterium]|nr:shikimate dehydrogenase [Deltaproteobacteria bacterium]